MNIIKRFFILYTIPFIALISCANRPTSLSETERNGFIAKEPLKYIKLAFSVKQDESNIVGVIDDASTSIASFTKEVAELQSEYLHRNFPSNKYSRDELKYVLPEARNTLRLPPKASTGQDGYVYSNFFCWKLLAPGVLQTNIEWGDITTPKRFTDSYIFKKIGSKWYFERHGDMMPFTYDAVGYFTVRPCARGGI
jgi:hypothetical protein